MCVFALTNTYHVLKSLVSNEVIIQSSILISDASKSYLRFLNLTIIWVVSFFDNEFLVTLYSADNSVLSNSVRFLFFGTLSELVITLLLIVNLIVSITTFIKFKLD